MKVNQLMGAAAAAALISALGSGPAAAAGFYVREQSVLALGRAFSGEAADVGAASLWWNPASIAAVPGRGDLALGVQHITVDATVTNTGTTIQRPGQPVQPVGGSQVQVNPIDKGDVPNMAASWRLNDQWVVGFTVAAPFNFTNRYPLDSFTRYQALKSRLFNIDVQPTVAWRPNDQLSLGVGLDVNYADATLSNAVPNLSAALPDGGSSLTGRGWDFGWVAGLQWRPVEQFTLGASYRSEIKHVLDGQVTVAGLLGPAAVGNTDVPGTARFETPAILTVSGRYKATDRLTLNAQAQWFEWSAFDAIRVEFSGRTQVTPQDYVNVTSVAVGAEYLVAPRLTVRGGVQHDPTPTPDVGRSARVPDGDRWFYAAGASFQATERIALDLSAGYIQFQDSAINSSAPAFAGTPLNTPVAIRGTVGGHGLILGAGMRMNF